jgi:hypothetical protein
MAYMSQEKKAKIAAELKKVMPKDWKYSLAVRHHSSVVLTISAAPVDLIAMMNERTEYKSNGYAQVNEYYLERQFSGSTLAIFERIKAALNIDNFNDSDIQTDYFHVGHYVDIHIGRWNKPFVVLVGKREPSREELQTKINELEAKLA